MNAKSFWSRKAYAPNGRVKRPEDKSQRGWFIIKGSNKVMPEFWAKVESDTKKGKLGYFANFSEDSQSIIIYHSCAEDLFEKTHIRNGIDELKGSLEVSVIHSNGSDDNNEEGFDGRDAEEEKEEVFVKKTIITEVETRKVTRTSPKAPNQWRAQNNNRAQYTNKWKNYRKF